MKKRRHWIWLLSGAVVTIALFVLAQTVMLSDETKLLSESEAKNQLREQMDGDIVFVRQSSDAFTYEVTRSQGVYQAVVSREDGTIIDLTRQVALDEGHGSKNNSNEPEDEETQSDASPGPDQTEDESTDAPEESTAEESSEESDEPTTGERERLSSEDIREQMLAEQNGDMTSFEYLEDDDMYRVTIEQEFTRYHFEVDAYSGEVLARETEDLTPELAITEEEAQSIARNQVDDESTRQQTTLTENDGVIFYIVLFHVSDNEQAEVHINAFSGDVETVTWEEREDQPQSESDEEEEAD
ncbi:putative membrane protein YkoI [Alkalibacillus flavidus]|uniref:Membrane protein YkoI n=1 Tax=Alkalibacillus flavidus TaxID=546021 RepID=A0ABV2KQU3_9BACI